jgi:hypothetical protein
MLEARNENEQRQARTQDFTVSGSADNDQDIHYFEMSVAMFD